jgi:uncharacterized phage-like protein YoqJ
MTRTPPTSAAQLFLTPGFSLGITGHRDLDAPVMSAYTRLIGLWFDKIRPAEVVAGMALGIDTVAAEAARERNIPLHAIVPGTWQPTRWKTEHQARWAEICAAAARVTIVDPSPLPPDPGARKAKVISTLLKRNTWIVANSTMLLACWDGRRGGGTTHAIRAAQKDNCPVLRLRPGTQGRLALGPTQVERLLADAETLGPIRPGLPTGLVPVVVPEPVTA